MLSCKKAPPSGELDAKRPERVSSDLIQKEADALVFSTIIFLFRFLPITLALYYLAPPKLKNTVQY